MHDETDSNAKTLERLVATLRAHEGLADTFVAAPRETIRPSAHLVTLPPAPLAGERLVLERTLGEGGMGVVRLATQRALGRKVAVKTLREAPSGTAGAQAALQILREAWIAGALEHPNVVPIYDVSTDAAGAPLIVMKRIEGEPWSTLLAQPERVRERHGVDDVLEWHLRVLTQVASALAYAHSRGIIHRDLKPDNVMIGEFGEVYLLDWGIAVSLVDDGSGRLPLARDVREIAGTPAYMAPEMLEPATMGLGVRTDVYLLGALLFEIIAGRPPHEGKNLQAMVASIVVSEPAFPKGFPAEARKLVKRAMARDPAERHASADELRRDVLGYLEHRASRKLAHEAKKSLVALEQALARTEGSPELRALAVYNLFGAARFGFRAALEGWPDNPSARRGLDRAVELVTRWELGSGDPRAAAALLRGHDVPHPELEAEVDAAVKRREAEERRLALLEQNLDPTVGTRTRTFIGAVFGLLWTVTPLVGWYRTSRGSEPSYLHALAPSVAFLLLGLAFATWARESLTKTLHNRRLSRTLGATFVLQMLLVAVGALAGLGPHATQLLHVLVWIVTLAFLSIHVERWFVLPALFDAAALLVAARVPWLLYPLMSACNLVLTLVLVIFWFPRQDLAAIDARRAELRRAVMAWREGRGFVLERTWGRGTPVPSAPAGATGTSPPSSE